MTCQNCGHTPAAHIWKDDPERSDCGQPCDCTAYREPEPADITPHICNAGHPGDCTRPDHPVPAVTDLPDAVVEAAAEAICDHPLGRVRQNMSPCLYCHELAAAALAAASGPWAEHLDAASPATEYVEQVAADNERLEAERDAALARNAELQRENGGLRIANAHLLSQVAEGNRLRDDMEAKFLNTKGDLGISVAMLDDARAERDALRAELDNLRGRLTALADKWELAADPGRWTSADELRAIVRGSDEGALCRQEFLYRDHLLPYVCVLATGHTGPHECSLSDGRVYRSAEEGDTE